MMLQRTQYICLHTRRMCHVNRGQKPEFALQAWVAVNLTADLQESFTWNTRQIYLWLTAEYKTERNQLNQAVFWNWIIESKVSRLGRLTCLQQIVQPAQEQGPYNQVLSKPQCPANMYLLTCLLSASVAAALSDCLSCIISVT